MRTWRDVALELQAAPSTRVIVPMSSVPHPREAGAVESIGAPDGQASDWRWPPDDDGAGMHAQAHGDTWVIHLDAVHPSTSLVGHLQADAPAWGVALGVGLGALIGAATKTGAARGAVLGGIWGVRMVAARRVAGGDEGPDT